METGLSLVASGVAIHGCAALSPKFGHLPAMLLALTGIAGERGGSAEGKTTGAPQVPGPRPLTREQGLQAAADVIRSLQGYRKNPTTGQCRTTLNFICEVLLRVSAGETNDIAKPNWF